MKRDATLIYLADLTHTGLKIATEGVPLNIGLVASYAQKMLGPAIEVHLFKYPESLIDALKTRPPAILGCSNYVWNTNLSDWMLGYAKRTNRAIVTVQGGSNYPFLPHLQAEFLRTREHTDFHTFYEAEVGFVNLIERFLEARTVERMKEQPIPGVHFLTPGREELVTGPASRRLTALDDIPSPYVNGMLDRFFDGALTPMMETTRGCPFACNFCNAGDDYYNKVNMFSLDYVREELTAIAPRAAAAGVANLWLADNNFGMYGRDAEVSRIIRQVQEKHGWPLVVVGFTGKNNKARILQTTEILGRTLPVSMSVQSMSKQVLVNIKRQNVSLDTYRQVNTALRQQGRLTHAEVIFPLPGETYETYMAGMKELIEGGTNRFLSYALLMNHGTDYKDPAYRQRYGYATKWRLITLDFGEYEGEPVFDLEEVAIATKDASFEDYLRVREFALVAESLYNDGLFSELVRYVGHYGISPFAWLRAVLEDRSSYPAGVERVFESFADESRGELFDSEADAIRFYSDPSHYARLVLGEIGGNVLFKHKARLIALHMDEWLECAVRAARHLVRGRRPADTALTDLQLADLREYLRHKLTDVLNVDEAASSLSRTFDYDILAWVADDSGRGLEEFRVAGEISYRFSFTDRQIADREESLRRYGTDPDGLAKIIMRVIPLTRLFRQVTVDRSSASVA